MKKILRVLHLLPRNMFADWFLDLFKSDGKTVKQRWSYLHYVHDPIFYARVVYNKTRPELVLSSF